MPRGDRTGPLGRGQMTGRQLGYCAGYDEPGYGQGGFYGCGRGRGRAQGGRGVAFRRGAGFPESGMGGPIEPPVNEADQLKDRIGRLEKTLKALNQRLATLGGVTED
ncbi:hypothetical protein A7E78_07845 [Syntrophotalea acetylenivorans]|uniref:DUF5320 domain-containing protein n=1 Tax=Syntrophotalea acetylenivorans TaxID=1842532 RepID=A0A1L3GP90_9BACT|nr:DUF5320 domain-containing protein [Syntrophotalea acetylenivorans]APG27757.1 hypothetical protein A7E78_07845 [Syntrophotalea acetylenivorans]